MSLIIDSHAHLNDEQFRDDIAETVARAHAAGVEGIINVGYDLPSSRLAVDMADQFSGLYAVVGLHPHDASQLTAKMIEEFVRMAQHPKVLAIGETGLDYYYDNSPREQQKRSFGKHLDLARQLDLPVVIHSRDATADTLAIVEKANDVRCLLHCFSGSWETAERYLAMGHYLSFGGPITFKNADKLRKVASRVPLDRVLIETDCPYLAPVPHRGKRNEPMHVTHVADKLAELHDCPVEEIISNTTRNTQLFFELG